MYKLKYLLWFMSLLSLIHAQNEYVSQIKVVDKCTHLTEVVTVNNLGIKGVLYENFESVKAIRACEQSIKEHPTDPHVQFLLARAYSKARRYKEGFELVKKSCKNGDIGGCTLLAGYYEHGLYAGKYDAKKAYLLYLWTCSKGDPQGCHNLAMLIENKRKYVSKNSKSKKDYLLDSCMGGLYSQSCVVYANHIHFKTIPYDKDIHEYSNYKACISGDSNSCSELWSSLTKNKDPLTQEKIFYSAKASCNNDNAKACRKVGALFGKKKDKVSNLMASTFYEDGCRNGDIRFSCWYAGTYKISRVKGIEQDIPEGIKYLEKSCYIGMNTFACYDLAKFYLYTQEEGYNDKKKAVKPLERACKIGNVRSLYMGCENGVELCCKEKQKYEVKHKK